MDYESRRKLHAARILLSSNNKSGDDIERQRAVVDVPQQGVDATMAVSADSTLSMNDSISSESTSSLELGDAGDGRTSGVDGNGTNGTAGTTSALDREMTEDEVSIMVQNALRKARRAMNNCSPNTIGGDDGDSTMNNCSPKTIGNDEESVMGNDDVGGAANGGEPPTDDGNNKLVSDKEVELGSHSTDTACVGSTKTNLARRIEEEIQIARSYAQKRYFHSSEDGVGMSEETESTVAAAAATSLPLSPKSVDTQKTPPIANRNRNAESLLVERDNDDHKNSSSSLKADSAKERIARSKDRIAAANERLSRMEVEGKISRTPSLLSAMSIDRGIDDNGLSREAETSTAFPLLISSGEEEDNAIPSQVDESSPAHDLNKADSFKSDTISAALAASPKAILTPNVHILHSSNKPPLPTSPGGGGRHADVIPPPPPNTNSTNKPRHHRQVLFRHPYPLPPPPPLPRSDAVIIAAHSAPEKDVHVRWVSPDTDLEALIIAAGEEENLIRRSNACGAIKVLASRESNQLKLCRTTGLLDVLVRACWDDAVDSDALDARTRAVATLLYLSESKDNRLIVARHAKTLQVLVKVVEEDTGEARWRATSTLATLAKTPGNRVLMGDFEKLATVLGNLMVISAKEEASEDENTKVDEKSGDAANAAGGTNKVAPSVIIEDDGTLNSSRLHGRNSSTTRPSFDTMDDSASRMLSSTYSGTETFTDASGTSNTYDDRTYESAEYDDDDIESDMESRAWRDTYEDEEECSIEEEEGFEMQISSLKKLNIENASDFLAKSQMSACATLTHLSKHCANAMKLCRNEQLLDNIILLAGLPENPLHTRCIEMLCNFSRLPSNNARLAAKPNCVDTLLSCGKSKTAEDRVWAIRTIQNLCSDASSKVGLATSAMLSVLSTAAMRKDYEEQFAAVGSLMNLSTEPGSIVPLTNTKTVVATLVHLAHSPNTPNPVRKIACDSLATIGLWLQTLASAGTVPEEIPFSPLPTHSATGWLRWDNA